MILAEPEKARIQEPPAEAPHAENYGLSAIILISLIVAFVVMLDLLSISRDLEYLRNHVWYYTPKQQEDVDVSSSTGPEIDPYIPLN